MKSISIKSICIFFAVFLISACILSSDYPEEARVNPGSGSGKYTVKFDKNGGTGTAPSSMKANLGDGITLPSGSALTKSGYTFSGWNTNSSGTGDNYGELTWYTVTDNVTLYAKWGSGSGSSGSGTESNPITLTAGTWTDGSITSSGRLWYSFNVTSGTTYYMWWNDQFDGDYTKTLDINVSVYFNGSYIGDEYNGWSFPYSYTPNSNGMIKMNVYPFDGGTGNFAIAYSTSSTRPGSSSSSGTGTESNPILLTAGVWATGSITSSASGSALWYSFNAASGTRYYVWWNDRDGDGSRSFDVQVAAYNTNGSSGFAEDSGYYYTACSITASSNGAVKLKVSPLNPGDTGTFDIVYSTSSTRP